MPNIQSDGEEGTPPPRGGEAGGRPGGAGALTAEQRAFVEDMGQHMVGWGLARTTGRVYAYLLLQEEPVRLERVSADLGLARSGVSVATRQLVHFGMARAISAGRTRRLLYEGLRDLEAVFAARNAQVRGLARQLDQGARVAPPGPGRDGLRAMAGMLDRLVTEGPRLLALLREEGRPR